MFELVSNDRPVHVVCYRPDKLATVESAVLVAPSVFIAHARFPPYRRRVRTTVYVCYADPDLDAIGDARPDNRNSRMSV